MLNGCPNISGTTEEGGKKIGNSGKQIMYVTGSLSFKILATLCQ